MNLDIGRGFVGCVPCSELPAFMAVPGSQAIRCAMCLRPVWASPSSLAIVRSGVPPLCIPLYDNQLLGASCFEIMYAVAKELAPGQAIEVIDSRSWDGKS